MRCYVNTIYVYSGIHCMQITDEYGDVRTRFSYKRELHCYEVNIYREHIRSVSCQFTICVNMLMIFCFYTTYIITSTLLYIVNCYIDIF